MGRQRDAANLIFPVIEKSDKSLFYDEPRIIYMLPRAFLPAMSITNSIVHVIEKSDKILFPTKLVFYTVAGVLACHVYDLLSSANSIVIYVIKKSDESLFTTNLVFHHLQQHSPV